MILFPVDETDLPPLNTMIGVSAVFGGATVMLASLIHNLPFYYKPARIVLGTGIGAIVGYALHRESTLQYKQLRERDLYRKRVLYQYQRDHNLLESDQ